jgi:hypothetical protein
MVLRASGRCATVLLAPASAGARSIRNAAGCLLGDGVTHVPHLAMTKRAAIYCRLSQDRTGAGVVVERQERECQELAASLGWDVVRVDVDNDVSAGGYFPRRSSMMFLLALVLGGAAQPAWSALECAERQRCDRDVPAAIEPCSTTAVASVGVGPVVQAPRRPGRQARPGRRGLSHDPSCRLVCQLTRHDVGPAELAVDDLEPVAPQRPDEGAAGALHGQHAVVDAVGQEHFGAASAAVGGLEPR